MLIQSERDNQKLQTAMKITVGLLNHLTSITLGDAQFRSFKISSSLFAPKWSKKFRMPNFGHSKFLPVFLHQNGPKNRNAQFWSFQVSSSLSALKWSKKIWNGQNFLQAYCNKKHQAMIKIKQKVSQWVDILQKLQNGLYFETGQNEYKKSYATTKTENWIKITRQCTPSPNPPPILSPPQKIQDGWLRFDYDSS